MAVLTVPQGETGITLLKRFVSTTHFVVVVLYRVPMLD
jgi:hypothetical protein